jgi:hypothetical protein
MLTGSSIGGTTLARQNLVGTLASVTDTGAGSVGISFENAQALATSGTQSSASGPIALTTVGAGSNLSLGSNVSAGTSSQITSSASITTVGTEAVTANGANTLTATGNFTQTGNLTASANGSGSNLTVASAGGAVSLNGTISASSGANTAISGPSGVTQTGSLNTNSGGDLTVTSTNGGISFGGTVNASSGANTTISGMAVAGAPGITVAPSGSFSTGSQTYTLFQLMGTGGTTNGIKLSGTINVAGPSGSGSVPVFILSGDGAIVQTGTLNVAAANFVLDSTGNIQLHSIEAALGSLGETSVNNAGLFPAASASPANPITFGGILNAPHSVVLISSGGGAITSLSGATLNIDQLGISGVGGTANLFGCIAGNCTPSAAETSTPSPTASNNYRFNTCAIGSPTCIVLPSLTPVQPSPISSFAVLAVAPTQEDIDAPLTNIFDEDQLCDRLYQSAPDIARTVCQ